MSKQSTREEIQINIVSTEDCHMTGNHRDARMQRHHRHVFIDQAATIKHNDHSQVKCRKISICISQKWVFMQVQPC